MKLLKDFWIVFSRVLVENDVKKAFSVACYRRKLGGKKEDAVGKMGETSRNGDMG